MANRHRKPGPFSTDQALTSLDRRTKAGRIMKTVVGELMDHLGDATPPQRLIVQAAALKAVRLSLLTENLLAGDPPGEGSDHHALAWLNSMRLDLQALGLERKVRPSLNLAEYLKTAATDQAEAAEAAAA
jgi:hypothetical protein